MKATQTTDFLFKGHFGLGKKYDIAADNFGFSLRYEHPNGRLYEGDSVAWLNSLDSESIDLIFADPPLMPCQPERRTLPER